MTHIATQYLEYEDHREEIASLNAILADLQACKRPELAPTVERILARLDHLMQGATLKSYP